MVELLCLVGSRGEQLRTVMYRSVYYHNQLFAEAIHRFLGFPFQGIGSENALDWALDSSRSRFLFKKAQD